MGIIGKTAGKIFNSLGIQVIRLSKLNDGPDKVTLSTYSKYYSQETISGRHFYNLGAGSFRHPYWTNIDKLSDWYKSVQKDNPVIDYDFFTKEPLPIESGVAELFYTSHAVEHVPDDVVAFLFGEVYRTMKPGGIFRITCPNIDLDYRSYMNKDLDFFYFRTSPQRNNNKTFDQSIREMTMEQALVWHVASNASLHHTDGADIRLSDAEVKSIMENNSKEDALNKIASMGDVEKQKLYPGNHINWWNPKKLESYLKQAGFSSVTQEAYGQSQSPVMRDLTLFDYTHPKLSLYVEAVK